MDEKIFDYQLIEEAKKYERLHNYSHPDYGRDETSTWLTIASVVGKNATQCKKRWKNLRQRYAREHLRLTSVAKGAGEYVSNWDYTDAMDFMSEFLVKSPNYLGNICGSETPKKDRFCRACLSLIDSDKSYTTFNIFNDPSFTEKLQQCAHLKVNAWDEYPHSICERCHSKVLDFFDFIIMCCKSVEKFDFMIENQINDRTESYLGEDASGKSCVNLENHSTPDLKDEHDKTTKEINKAERITNDQQTCTAEIKEDRSNVKKNLADAVERNKSPTEQLSKNVCDDPLEQHEKSQLEEKAIANTTNLTQCKNKGDLSNSMENRLTDREVICWKKRKNVRKTRAYQTVREDPLEQIDDLPLVKKEIDVQNSLNDILSEQIDTDFIIEEVVDDGTFDNLETEYSKIEIQVLENIQQEVCEIKIENTLIGNSSADETEASYHMQTTLYDEFIEADGILEVTTDDEFPEIEDENLKTTIGDEFNELDDVFIEVENSCEDDMPVLDEAELDSEECLQGSDRTPFVCDVDNCQKSYKSQFNLRKHKKEYHKCKNIIIEEKPKDGRRTKYVCDTCGKIVRDLTSFRLHKLVHVDRSKWPCACDVAGCTKRFKTLFLLSVHKKRHAGIKAFKCPHCDMRKTTKFELKQHMQSHDNLKYPCKICSKVYATTMSLYKHVTGMHNKNSYETQACSFCDRILSSARNKQIHELIHTGEKSHECAECNSKFHTQESLQSHMAVHAGPYICDECGVEFRWPHYLNAHKKEHKLGVKPFACDQCDKTFKSSYNLQHHKILHVEGTIPFKCDECGQGFRWKGSYHAHKKKHLKDSNVNEKKQPRIYRKKRSLADLDVVEKKKVK